MRGARGIEFGVDLPAIPALGLGSAPPGTSTGDVSPSPSNGSKEASYIREWTRFLSGWKRDEKNGDSQVTVSSTQSKESVTMEETEEERDEVKRQRQREFTKGDQVVRASTDKLSLVFDWIVDQVPNSQLLTGAGTLPAASDLFKGKDKEPDAPKGRESQNRDDSRKLAAEMIAHTVSAGLSSSSTSSPSAHNDVPPLRFPSDTKPENLVGEVKKMMERERQSWRKNELATKADLERFYVALTRKMWDEGL